MFDLTWFEFHFFALRRWFGRYDVFSYFHSWTSHLSDLHSTTAQGGQFNRVILSFGRQGQVAGFLRDHRRLNVAISRPKTMLLVLLEESVGRFDGLIWHFRQVFRELQVEHVLPSELLADASRAAVNVISAMNQVPIVDDPRVRNVCDRHASFFDTYQVGIIGSLDSLSEFPLSDSDSEDALAEKADVLDVRAAISEARHDDDQTQAPEEVEDHTSTAHQRPIPLEAILSAGAGWSRFGMVWIGNPHKFHLSWLYYYEEDRFDGVPMYVTCFQSIFFATRDFLKSHFFRPSVRFQT